MLDTEIVVVGALSAVACALVGNFLLLRGMSMMGDAISHAVLPGLAIAFLLSGTRDSLPMLTGAAIAGVLTAALTQWVHSFGNVDRGAAMGVVFTTLFALGLLLLVRGADAVDLDPNCVLYGAIEFVPLDRTSLFGWSVPRAAVTITITLLLNLIIISALFKEFRIAAFDPALAATQGISPHLLHYILMILVAMTTVAAFESVGSILVIAMLIVPPAAAHLLTDRLTVMILLSAVIAALAAAGGHLAAITVPTWFGFDVTSTAGMMAVFVGLCFLLALIFAPRQGLLSRMRHRAALTLRIAQEDALGLLYRLEEAGLRGEPALVRSLLRIARGLSRFTTRLALWRLRQRGHVRRRGDGFEMTDAGRTVARDLVRVHRLWETYLQKHLVGPQQEWHFAAEQLEHVTDAELRRRLGQTVHGAGTDPHGKPIPPA
jgi:manganese/zinc/iron transport system permease protein